MGNFSNYWDLHTLFTKIKNKIKSVSDSIPTKLSDLTADATHRTVTDTEKSTWNSKSNFSGSYNDLTNKPTIPAAQVNSDWNATTGVAKINNKPTLATVATSGSYNDLSNKPTIPTKTSELTNNSNFVADSSYVHTDNNYTTAEKTKLSGIASGAEANVQSDWNQTTTTADDFIKNKPSSMPASDVSAWAKASTKPSYNFGEIGAGVATIGNGNANFGIKWRTQDTWLSGVYYNTSGDESVIFANENTRTSWMFAYTDMDTYPAWTTLTPSMQIKNGKVTINKLIPNNEQASYNLDVNGTANATTIYENGTALSSKYAAKSDIPTVNNGTLTIQKNGTNVQTFTANQSTNATANITVPTALSDLTADATHRLVSDTEKSTWNGKATTTDITNAINALDVSSVGGSGKYISAISETDGKISATATNMPTIPSFPLSAANGGTGKTSLNDAANALMNSLTEGTSDPTDNDYYISQYASGGTSTTTYHRRPVSKLWNYIKSKLATVATSGSYNDLSNKPTIPAAANNGTLTIQKNGTNVQTFTANQSSNVTANITVPTKVSELTNDSGYTTNTGTVTSVKVGSTSYSPSGGVVSLPAYPSVSPTRTLLYDMSFTTSGWKTVSGPNIWSYKKILIIMFETHDSSITDYWYPYVRYTSMECWPEDLYQANMPNAQHIEFTYRQKPCYLGFGTSQCSAYVNLSTSDVPGARSGVRVKIYGLS